MIPILFYRERNTGELKKEDIYGESALRFLYCSRLGRLLVKRLSSIPLISTLCGWWQSLPFTKRKIVPFIKKYKIDPSEFEKDIDAFPSFNDFFTRKLKKKARPLAKGLILPADGRYLFHQNIKKCDGFLVKGKKFELTRLIGHPDLARIYEEGSMILARLSPTDYHRFHFPCDCLPNTAQLINGSLYSVNPISVRQRIEVFTENKRMITSLETAKHGRITYIEIGATAVGSIHQTYHPGKYYKKGDEKGFFSFGGSSLILLFEPDTIQIDSYLLENSSQKIETLCLFGQPIENNI
ncbi:MAG: archaetidylserine decarboxylase [Chlamydiales bacterium]